MKRFCTTCWTEVGPDDGFCTLCGAHVSGEAGQNDSSATEAEGPVLPADDGAEVHRDSNVMHPGRGVKTAALAAVVVLISIVVWLNLQVNEFNQRRFTGARGAPSAPQRSVGRAAITPNHTALLGDFAGHWRIIEGPTELLDGLTEFELVEENDTLIAVGFEEIGLSGFVIEDGLLHCSVKIGPTRVDLTGALSQDKRELELRIEPPVGPDMIIKAARK